MRHIEARARHAGFGESIYGDDEMEDRWIYEIVRAALVIMDGRAHLLMRICCYCGVTQHQNRAGAWLTDHCPDVTVCMWCEAEHALERRERHPAQPGAHDRPPLGPPLVPPPWWQRWAAAWRARRGAT